MMGRLITFALVLIFLSGCAYTTKITWTKDGAILKSNVKSNAAINLEKKEAIIQQLSDETFLEKILPKNIELNK